MKWSAAFLATLCAAGLILWLMRPPLPEDSPIPLAKDARLDTILIFGTSLSSAPRYSWPDDLGEALSTCTDAPVTMARLTMPGAGSAWGESVLDQVIASNPNVIIMEFAINDADIVDGVSIAKSRDTHARILEALQTALPQTQIVLMTTNPTSGLNWMKRYQLGRYFRLYSSLSQRFQTGLIHMAPHWSGYNIPDGIHPQNGDASAVMVPQLLEIVSAGRCTLPG